jgi:hypothetical protein
MEQGMRTSSDCEEQAVEVVNGSSMSLRTQSGSNPAKVKPEKVKKQCPYCKAQVYELAKHLKNVHAVTDRITEKTVDQWIAQHPTLETFDQPTNQPTNQPQAERKNFFDWVQGVEDVEDAWAKIFDWFSENRPELNDKEIFLSLWSNRENGVLAEIDCVIDKNKHAKYCKTGIPTTFFPPSESVTLHDYLTSLECVNEPLTLSQAIIFHHFFITSCVVIVTSQQGYMVKTQKGTWTPYSAKALCKIIDRFVMPVIGKNKVNEMKFSHFLTERHEISQCLKKYEKVDFTNQASNRVFPTFQGFPHKQLQTIDLELIQPFLDHVKNIICDGDEKLYEIEMMKNAWIFQNPQQHMNWATVLVGQQGTGKNFYTNVLCQL